MTLEQRNFVTEKLRAAIAAPSCCPELKEVGMEWLQESGGDHEADVNTIDDTIAFFGSPAAAAMFGAEQAKGMAAQAREHKANGGKFCFCPACSNGAEILAIKDQLL